MRALIGGVIGAIVFAGAVWAIAGATTPANAGGPYQIYIFDNAEEQSIYALAVGDRAAAAMVEDCAGRLMDDAYTVVAGLRARSRNEHDGLSVVWVEGEGSRVNLGRCGQHEEDEDSERDDWDSLVVVRGASAAQARHLIREIHGLSREDRNAMIDALGLNRPARARR
jgi:hypothetical protein